MNKIYITVVNVPKNKTLTAVTVGCRMIFVYL